MLSFSKDLLVFSRKCLEDKILWPELHKTIASDPMFTDWFTLKITLNLDRLVQTAQPSNENSENHQALFKWWAFENTWLGVFLLDWNSLVLYFVLCITYEPLTFLLFHFLTICDGETLWLASVPKEANLLIKGTHLSTFYPILVILCSRL